MEKIEFVKCACQHCDNQKQDKYKCCYSCHFTKSCQVELREDWIFRRGYYADKA